MGGHGGLNILPQKSWNVYGRKNRLKVVQDEEAEAQKLAAERKKAEHIGREARLATLKQAEAGINTAEVSVSGGHINFWADWESSAANAAVNEELKNERRKRGDVLTQTSDARFDEGFKLMHGLNGPAPWYARRIAQDGAAAEQSQAAAEQSQAAAAAVPATALDDCRQTRSAAEQGSAAGERLVGEKVGEKRGSEGLNGAHAAADCVDGDEWSDRKRHKKSKDSKHSHRKRRCEDGAPAAKKSIADLRAERLQREAAEAERTRALLRNAFR